MSTWQEFTKRIAFRRLKINISFVCFLQGGELSESGSVDELSTGHFHMPYDIVREGTGETVFYLKVW